MAVVLSWVLDQTSATTCLLLLRTRTKLVSPVPVTYALPHTDWTRRRETIHRSDAQLSALNIWLHQL